MTGPGWRFVRDEGTDGIELDANSPWARLVEESGRLAEQGRLSEPSEFWSAR